MSDEAFPLFQWDKNVPNIRKGPCLSIGALTIQQDDIHTDMHAFASPMSVTHREHMIQN